MAIAYLLRCTLQAAAVVAAAVQGAGSTARAFVAMAKLDGPVRCAAGKCRGALLVQASPTRCNLPVILP